jgi:hypothetical protein
VKLKSSGAIFLWFSEYHNSLGGWCKDMKRGCNIMFHNSPNKSEIEVAEEGGVSRGISGKASQNWDTGLTVKTASNLNHREASPFGKPLCNNMKSS